MFDLYDAIRIIFILSLILVIHSIVNGQTCSIQSVNFRPPDPKPGQSLRIYVELIPNGQNVRRKITINFTTTTDLNNNGVYEPNEKIRFSPITANVNDEDEAEISVYQVPRINLPQKYSVIVSCGATRKSQVILVDMNNSKPACGKTTGRACVNGATGLAGLKNPFRKRGTNNSYQGEKFVYVYNLKEKILTQITKDSEALYLSPNWGNNSRNLVFVINQNGGRKIGWTDIDKKNIQILTNGSNDDSPYWLPDNKTVLFVRNNRLHFVDTETRKTKTLDDNLQVDTVLSVFKNQAGNISVIYEAPDPDIVENKATFLLEMDLNFSFKKTEQLFEDIRLFLFNQTSPSNQLVYTELVNKKLSSKEDVQLRQLFINPGTNEASQKVFDDDFNYYEPAWAPDGDKIVFVSNRPPKKL